MGPPKNPGPVNKPAPPASKPATPGDRAAPFKKNQRSFVITTAVIGLVIVVAIAGVVLAVKARTRQRLAAGDPEAKAVEALKAEYDPQELELDEKGHVVKLKLEGGHVDDPALDLVGNFKWLRSLSLHKATVTDIGLAKLKDLKRLEALGITNTRITDSGLALLHKMPSLKYLWVCETSELTPQGIAALKQALPGLNVYVMNRPKEKSD